MLSILPPKITAAAFSLIAFCAGGWSLSTIGSTASAAEKISDRLGWKLEYDDAGRVVKLTDPAGRATQMKYTFDNAKRLRKLVRANKENTVTNEFDGQGRPQSMTDGAGTVSYGYDPQGRLNKVQRKGAAGISYTYDTLSRVTRLQVGDFYKIDYAYDFLGRLESMKTLVGKIKYEYLTGQGQVVRTLPNKVKTIWSYDPKGQLQKLVHADAKNVILAEYAYQYRPDGLIAAIAERSGAGQVVKSYEYDRMKRLVRAKSSDGQEHVYEYDQVGNRLKATATGKPPQAVTYNWIGQVASVNGQRTEHDAAGNVTAMPLNGATIRYGHNQDGQLVDVASGKATYKYDGDGRLVARKAGDTESKFIPDPVAPIWRPLIIEEKGAPRALMVWQSEAPLLTIRNGNPEYFLHDHLGSVRLVADAQGKVSRRFEYDSFGNMADSARATEFAPRFAGLFWDPASNVYLTLARAYAPQLGRFLQFEPKAKITEGLHNQSHPYAYCGNDPLNWVDSDGNERRPVNPRSAGVGVTLIPPGFTFHDKVKNYVDNWLTDWKDKIPAGEKVSIVFLGINNRWDDANELTDQNFRNNNYTIVVPTYGGISRDLDKLRTANDYLRTASPIGIPAIAISPIPIQIHTRKLGIPELLDHVEKQGYRVGALVFESGANFVLQENVSRLVAYARSHSRLPEIGVLSGSISKEAHAIPLQNAKYKLTDLGEYGDGSVQKLVPALERRSADFAPFRIAPIGVPGYIFNLAKTLGKYGPDGTLLSDNVGSNDIPVQLATPIATKERSHGYKARKDLVDSYIAAINGNPLPTNAIMGTHVFASSVPLSGAELQAWREQQRRSRSSGPNSISGQEHSAGSPSIAADSELDPQRLAESRTLANLMMKQIGAARDAIRMYDVSGGDGRVAGPGGYASPGGSRALDAYRQNLTRTPSTVGGVFLGGSGQALAGLGLLNGIARDANGNLVLVGKGGEQIKLPALRLDDLVTVFRSVYLNGEGPTVTIDPNPQNPEGPTMIIKHSKATDGTYVGWILYQADRIMKGYTISKDNITKKSVTSSVPGFTEVLDRIFFGGEGPEKRRKEGIWERFWIVAAEVLRFGAPKNELTIFDVPLKVKTQKMKWEKGKLVDDAKGESSPGALAFTKWFTKNYELIAGEQMLTPPRESGITEPVPVFTELRRIALITAIAEKLRDQGVPMPFWMRDYKFRAVPFEKTTPALEVTRSNKKDNARIYGGVALTAADKDVKNFGAKADLSKLSKENAKKAQAQLKLGAALEEAIRSQMAGAEPLKVRALTQQGAGFQAVALPGTDTMALAPALLEETDMIVPVENGEPIRLIRSYNSFFNPVGPWGKGWALDLPQLVQVQVPVRRDDKGVTFQQAYELITPLNSLYARFSKIGKVAELNGSSLQVPDQPGEFYGLADARPDFLSGATRKLIRKDGGAWHFTEAGDLVATEQAGSRVVYERDAKRQLTRIVGLRGRKPVATIELRYNAAGRIDSAKTTVGKNDVVVRYEYDPSGKLIGVLSNSGRLGYRYENSLVTAVTYQTGVKKAAAKTLRRFQYAPQGRLLAEFDANGAKTEYKVSTDAKGSKLAIVYPGKKSPSEVTQYDQAFRPMKMTATNGSEYSWTYGQDGAVVLNTKDAEGRKARITEAVGKRTRTVQIEGGRTFEGKFDAAGRLISLTDNKLSVLQQEWSRDGRLVRAVDETAATHFEYDRDGLPSRVLLAPPKEKGKFSHWQSTELGPSGLPRKIADSSGLEMAIDYAEGGAIKAAGIKRGGKQYGFEIGRDKTGRMQEVKSSWGKQRYDYDATGQLSKLEVESGGQKSVAEWKAGLLQKLRQFDDGEFSMAYHDQGKRAGLPKKITTPNQLALGYEYDGENRLSRIDVGAVYRLSLDYDKKGRLAGWNYTAVKR